MPGMEVSLQSNCTPEEKLQSEEKFQLSVLFRHLLNGCVEKKPIVQDQSTDKLDPEVFRALTLADQRYGKITCAEAVPDPPKQGV